MYAKPRWCDPKTAIKYIGRYLGRPVITTSRIDKYKGDFVTFHYNRHEEDRYVEETIPVMEFIGRLIRHIRKKHFKMILFCFYHSMGGYQLTEVVQDRACIDFMKMLSYLLLCQLISPIVY